MLHEIWTWENFSQLIFPGFCDSYISPDSFLNCQLCDEYDIAHFDDTAPEGFWDAYRNLVGKRAAELIGLATRKRQKGIVLGVEYAGLWSPQYYNFETDRLILNVVVCKKKLEEWILRHSRVFCDYLMRHWSSYPGFQSFVPNTFCKLKRSHYYDAIILEYFIRDSVMRAVSGRVKERWMEYMLYDYISETLTIDDVLKNVEEGNVKPAEKGGLPFAV